MWTYKLEYYNIKWAEFREPDIGNQMTAIACVNYPRMNSWASDFNGNNLLLLEEVISSIGVL